MALSAVASDLPKTVSEFPKYFLFLIKAAGATNGGSGLSEEAGGLFVDVSEFTKYFFINLAARVFHIATLFAEGVVLLSEDIAGMSGFAAGFSELPAGLSDSVTKLPDSAVELSDAAAGLSEDADGLLEVESKFNENGFFFKITFANGAAEVSGVEARFSAEGARF